MPKILTDCYKVIDSQGFQVVVSSEVVTECLGADKISWTYSVFQNSLMITLLLDKSVWIGHPKCVVADYKVVSAADAFLNAF